jgi:hypothetical protein
MSEVKFKEMMISNKPRLGNFVVYIAGVRTPAFNVTVTNSIWQFPQATISVPPDKNLIRLGEDDRAHVAIFYWDTYYKDKTQLNDPKPNKYRLIFDGEIFGWSFNKSASQKEIVFKAVGFPFILTQFFVSMTSSLNETFLSQLKTGGDAAQTIFRMENLFPFTIFTQGLDGRAANQLRAPADYINHLIDMMSGKLRSGVTDEGEPKDKISGINIELMRFFMRYLKAVKLKERVGSFDDGPPYQGSPLTPDDKLEDDFSIVREVQNIETIKTILHKTGQLASSQIRSGSLWDFAQFFFKIFFHEILMLSTPKARSGMPKDIITKPQTLFTIVPRCNVIFPSMMGQLNFS